MIPKRMMFLVFVIAALASVGLERAPFTVPLSLEDAQACGFTIDDFAPSGKIEYAPTQAWWLSFMRKQEYFGAITVGLAAAFVAFALSAVRQLGAGIASGAAVGGGVLALAAVCLGCMAPVLSIIGIGIGGAALVDIPKWLLALNTLLLTGWGTMFLSRRLTSCPVLPRATQSCAAAPSSH